MTTLVIFFLFFVYLMDIVKKKTNGQKTKTN